MSTTSNIPTPEQRQQILHVYGEKGDRLVREKERQYITSDFSLDSLEARKGWQVSPT